MPGIFNTNRILYVANSLVANGGVERRNLDQVCHLRGRGYEVDVAVLRAIGPALDVYRAAGVSVHYFHAYDAGPTQALRLRPCALARFWWFLWRRRYGIVVASQFPSHYVARLMCFPTLGRRVFAMQRTNLTRLKPGYRRLERICALWTRRIICVSSAVADGLHELCGVPYKRLKVIHEGYELPADEAPPHDLQERLRGCFVYGCVANFNPGKRQHVLVDAFHAARQSRRDVRLVLVGDGDTRKETEARVRELGLTDLVIFTGNVDNPNAYYPLFDAFVYPSISEGMGGAIVEARLHRLPVICADVRPMNDYIRDAEDGLLFVPDDSDALSRCMVRLREDDELRQRIAACGQERALTTFDRARQMDELEAELVRG